MSWWNNISVYFCNIRNELWKMWKHVEGALLKLGRSFGGDHVEPLQPSHPSSRYLNGLCCLPSVSPCLPHAEIFKDFQRECPVPSAQGVASDGQSALTWH